jgi:ATP-dependent helicase Lhr and Lhr-like helicase
MGGRQFHPAVERWFSSEFDVASPVQLRAWESIKSGRDTLISAPTGSGKTLAAFLSVIDDVLVRSIEEGLPDATQVLYVSPLKALSNDIQKNLQQPLEGIRRELAGLLIDDVPIRADVRTGDTPQSERARMRRRPPHILVTTPESLYILLTSDSGRGMLSSVRTVIVDEIHALAGNKRGAHLSLSLARLEALLEARPQRIGVSATSRPIEAMADYLSGTARARAEIIDEGHVRQRDLALTLPASALTPLMEGEAWGEIYDCLTELIESHRTTLVFVNTRRLAERVARHLAERVGEELVTSHHGSLAKEHRLRAEQRLKGGQLKAIVATASLELGIDIGDVDLVCQLGSPRGITAFLQRVGRSGHGIGRVPMGRLFPLSRDELVESVALLKSVRAGELDAQTICRGPLDVLAQQIVAECGMREWRLEDLFEVFRTTDNYRELDIDAFRGLVEMLADGFTTHRGRRSAHLHFDRVNNVIRGRRGARLTAITNGGAIPDQFDFDVVLLPEEFPIGSVNEDFATESLAGDIFQLGNTSYRILKVAGGKVYVEDARGQPPSIPFWFGEAPGRSDELSRAVSALRQEIDARLSLASPAEVAAALDAELGLGASAASQLVEYLAAGRAAFGSLPTQSRIVFERFFDEAGDTHLVIHSPFGSRINRAFGLSLRKCFCRRFNFELQAAALEDSIILSLGAVHSFALEDVKRYLSSRTIERVLEQAVLGAPLFETHWRWNATIALAVRRFRNGRKTPPQLQRMDAEDLLATAFPEQLACAENLPGGDIEIPDHPLVRQTMHDCTRVAMDREGLAALLESLETGRIEVICADLTSPSPLAQEILAARPFAFLDDAPAEERRTLAVQARRYMDPAEASELGRLDPAAIDRVRDEAWPRVGNADELHDALTLMGFMTRAEGSGQGRHGADLRREFEELETAGRATEFTSPVAGALWVTAERLGEIELVFPDGAKRRELVELRGKIDDASDALIELCRGRLEALGPVTAAELAAAFGLPETAMATPLAALEQRGIVMRGRYSDAGTDQWCERRLLARIHRLTLSRLRSEIEPVNVADYQRFLFRWQGLGAHRREGVEALRAILSELKGLTPPAIAWEREILPARLAHYDSGLLDELSAAGDVVWWRPPRAAGAPPASSTVAASPIAILPRVELPFWRALASGPSGDQGLGSAAAAVHEALTARGALFFVDIVTATGLLRVQVEDALGELVAAGLVTSDAFGGLRAVIAPQRNRPSFRSRARTRRRLVSFDRAGRWALVPAETSGPVSREEAVEHAADSLLCRYGVVVRAVLAREPLVPTWRELVAVFRRREARGEIRGGRFVEPLGGEQFALAEAVEALRRTRRERDGDEWVVISAADPLNLPAMNGAERKIAAIGANRIVYMNGVPVAAAMGQRVELLRSGDGSLMEQVRETLGSGPAGSRTMRPQMTRARS